MSPGKVHRKTSFTFISLKNFGLKSDKFRLVKIVCFLGVKLILSCQKTVKDFYIILDSVIVQTRIFIKKRSSLTCLWPEIFSPENTYFKQNRDIICAPTVCIAEAAMVDLPSFDSQSACFIM
jgi:hypothetical protein